MSDVFTEGPYLSDWLKGETERPKDYCREEITVLAGEDLDTGAVLGKITASGKYVAWDPDASDGSQTVRGVLITAVEGDTSIDQPSAALVRGPATIVSGKLILADDLDAGDLATAVTALAALGIVDSTEA